MGYSPWVHKQSDMSERLTLSLSLSQPLSTPSTPSSQLQAWACDPSLFNLVQATDSGKHKSHSVHCDPLLLENLLVMSFPGTCWPLCGAWFQCQSINVPWSQEFPGVRVWT